MVPPTLLTRISMRPKRLWAARMTSVQGACCSRSAVRLRTRSPRSSWTSSERSTATSQAPSSSKRSATRRPMPWAAPVTSATLSLKRGFITISSGGIAGHQGIGGEFLVVEAARGHALSLEVLPYGIDHRWRATQVNVDLPAVEQPGRDVPGHITLARVQGLRVGDTSDEVEIRQALAEPLQRLDHDQVLVPGNPINQMDRLTFVALGEHFEHRQKRRQSGATGQKQQRPDHRAQVETAQRPAHRDLFAGLGPTQPAAHQPTRDMLDQKADVVLAGQAAERIRAG